MEQYSKDVNATVEHSALSTHGTLFAARLDDTKRPRLGRIGGMMSPRTPMLIFGSRSLALSPVGRPVAVECHHMYHVCERTISRLI